MVRKVLGGIVMYSLIIFLVIEFGPSFDFHAISISPPESLRSTPVFLLIGGIFWLVYDVLRYVLKIITIPLNRFTFGFASVLVNVGMIYAFMYAVDYADIGVHIALGHVVEILILAFILSVFGLFIKYL